MVVADDVLLMRQGVVRVLEAIPGVDVVAECDDAEQLLAAVAKHEPDVALTDIAMPPTHTDEGIRAAIQLRSERPDLGIVVLSQYAEPDYVLDLFDNGSDHLGYLLKERIGDPEELARAVDAVAAGDSVVDPKIVEILVSARSSADRAVDRLTPRETEVLSVMAEGLNNAAIAQRLVLSDKAVAKHINAIFSKLDLGGDEASHRRVKAVLTWLAH
ncbi:MAG: DNA-binding response regulator [Acidimicrobiales bacterium]|nr:MAG: DNA-binding response regulator [Acidimicrobiales bacterium]